MNFRLAILFALLLVPSTRTLVADVTGVLVPAYGNPTFMDDGPIMWSSLVATAQDPNREFAIRAIVNPMSGPGAPADQQRFRENYFGASGNGPASQFRNAGGQTFGYVWTDRADKNLALVTGEIDAYLGGTYAGNFDGVFLDDFYNDPGDLAYYQQVYSHVNDNYPGALIIGNVGDVGDLNGLTPTQAFDLISPLDTLVSHEMKKVDPDPSNSDYLNRFTPLTHANQFPDSKFAHLVHDVGNVWETSLLDLARTRDTGWFYVTPDSGENPWDNFDPVFWNDFTASINAIPEPISPTQFSFVRGTFVSGDLSSLQSSDNLDLVGRRNIVDIQSRIHVEFTGISPAAMPQSIKFGFEGSVFARSNVVQTIELFDYSVGAWEVLDVRDAIRLSDVSFELNATGDLQRFIEPGTNLMESRIRFDSANQRQAFSSSIDHIYWIVD